MNLEPLFFIGDASDAEARVYVSLVREGLTDDARLEGELVGPYCRYSQTLSARIPFVDRGPGATILAEAMVPDPCFWTSELPFLYSATLRLIGASQIPSAAGSDTIVNNRSLGIRRLGVRGSSIYLDQKRFVVRAAQPPHVALDDLRVARTNEVALVVSAPTDELLHEASQDGVLLAVRHESTANRSPRTLPEEQQFHITDMLQRLARWPCVAVVILDDSVPVDKPERLAARNLLLAQQIGHQDEGQTVNVVPWADVLWWNIGSTEPPTIKPSSERPLIVHRHGVNAGIEQARRACDRLQADLAPLGDFAGYVVT